MLRIIKIALLILLAANVANSQTAVGSYNASGHGYVQSTHEDASPVYLTARNAETGTGTGTSNISIGQFIVGGASIGVYRTFLCIPLKALSKRTVYACTLYVNGNLDQSVTDFDIDVVSAAQYKSTLGTNDFSHFTGWAASGVYSITALSETWNTSDYSADWNAIVFNEDGIAAVQSALNDTLWIALLSDEDVNASENTGNEYVSFDSPSDTNKPYLSIEYEADNPKNADINTKYLWYNGDPVPLWR